MVKLFREVACVAQYFCDADGTVDHVGDKIAQVPLETQRDVTLSQSLASSETLNFPQKNVKAVYTFGFTMRRMFPFVATNSIPLTRLHHIFVMPLPNAGLHQDLSNHTSLPTGATQP